MPSYRARHSTTRAGGSAGSRGSRASCRQTSGWRRAATGRPTGVWATSPPTATASRLGRTTMNRTRRHIATAWGSPATSPARTTTNTTRRLDFPGADTMTTVRLFRTISSAVRRTLRSRVPHRAARAHLPSLHDFRAPPRVASRAVTPPSPRPSSPPRPLDRSIRRISGEGADAPRPSGRRRPGRPLPRAPVLPFRQISRRVARMVVFRLARRRILVQTRAQGGVPRGTSPPRRASRVQARQFPHPLQTRVHVRRADGAAVL